MDLIEEINKLYKEVKTVCPLVHHITNYVTVNDCANITLALGASPIMADDIKEVEDIQKISSALLINIGTLNERTITSMLKAGKKANELKHPVILDPVGAGASALRNETTDKLLQEINFSIIRGNISEIKYINGLKSNTKGVDADESDEENSLSIAINLAKEVADKFKTVVAMTGKTDIITDGKRVILIENGLAMLKKVSGTGCMTTSLSASFAGVTNNFLLAASAGVLSMGIAGEMAYAKNGNSGLSSFRCAIIDSISLLTENTLKKYAKIKEN